MVNRSKRANRRCQIDHVTHQIDRVTHQIDRVTHQIDRVAHLIPNFTPHCPIKAQQAGEKIGGTARQVLPSAAVAAQQTKCAGGRISRRQNNLSSKPIRLGISLAVLIAVKATRS